MPRLQFIITTACPSRKRCGQALLKPPGMGAHRRCSLEKRLAVSRDVVRTHPRRRLGWGRGFVVISGEELVELCVKLRLLCFIVMAYCHAGALSTALLREWWTVFERLASVFAVFPVEFALLSRTGLLDVFNTRPAHA